MEKSFFFISSITGGLFVFLWRIISSVLNINVLIISMIDLVSFIEEDSINDSIRSTTSIILTRFYIFKWKTKKIKNKGLFKYTTKILTLKMSLYSRTIDRVFSDISNDIYESNRMELIYQEHRKLFKSKYNEYVKNKRYIRGYNSFIYHTFRNYINLDKRDQLLFEIYMRQRTVKFDTQKMDKGHRMYYNDLRGKLLGNDIIDICRKKSHNRIT